MRNRIHFTHSGEIDARRQPSEDILGDKFIVLVSFWSCFALFLWLNIGGNGTGTCSFKKYMPPPLPYYPFPLPHFASIFFVYLWYFRWSNYIVTLPRYFSFRLPHLNIPTGPPADELDKNSQRMWLSENLSHWNGYRFKLI